ncbi:hypothetical protein OC846_004678 [Tilletia horrida]|uniref:Luciferase domain-containing protein n=1 Tax=Tilletia horrida TaxID=155126 RepID=A0AAN6GMP9_9BASI|nr:hypothetical protein OC846_004678 [Tilletia horrida]KAK0554644.1 hypothetical protein OC845_000676 [Tilletia horrida]KAK0563264.1 hypothetical protein OC861_004904 [Tilletia horrida]
MSSSAFPHFELSLDSLKALYRRAPYSFNALSAFIASYLVNTAYVDYQKFMRIGRGGLLPYNVLGWAISLLMRPFTLSRQRMIDADGLPPPYKRDAALSSLPKRKGGRPQVYGLAPQRQLNQKSEKQKEYTSILNAHLDSLVSEHASAIQTGPSALEGGSVPALFSIDPARRSPLSYQYVSGTSHSEFAHIHGYDGSLHLTMSPADARLVITQGWGQLHSLSGIGYRGFWMPKFLRNWGPYPSSSNPGKGGRLPPTYTFIYSPRNEEEIETIKSLILAAAKFSAGIVV